jgi:hypothetical protein
LNLGELTHVEPVDFCEEERFALLGRELGGRVLERATKESALPLSLGRDPGPNLGDGVALFSVERGGGNLSFAMGIDSQPAGDGEEPRGESGGAVLVEVGERSACTKEDLLREVLDVRTATEAAREKREYEGFVMKDEGADRSGLPHTAGGECGGIELGMERRTLPFLRCLVHGGHA